MTQVWAHVTLKNNPNLALVQAGLRNAGFDQKHWNAGENRMEGIIAEGQMNNLLGVPDVDSVKAIREIH